MLKHNITEAVLKEIASNDLDVAPEETPPNTGPQFPVIIEAENLPVPVIIYPEFF